MVALGLVDLLARRVRRVGVFRPVTRSPAGTDKLLELLLDHDGVDLPSARCVGVTYEDVHADPEAALTTIVERYREVERECDAVIVVGDPPLVVVAPARKRRIVAEHECFASAAALNLFDDGVAGGRATLSASVRQFSASS